MSEPLRPEIVPDSEGHRAVAAMPRRMADLVQLARFDRPIGAELLFWPGAWAVALAGAPGRWDYILLILAGAFVMRGAGCVYNDIVDRDLDTRIARTRSRPVASGRISLKLAWAWLVTLALIGFVINLQLPLTAQIVGIVSLAPVAVYPFMKRITWWPQAWLGIVFSWATLVGWAAVAGTIEWPGLLLWFGAISWVIGYDTIYALQDIEDDALAGVKSSARALGENARGGIAGFYVLALLLWGWAIWGMRPQPLALLALLPVALHLGWQVATLRRGDPAHCLRLFRANRVAGLLMFVGCAIVAAA